MIYSAGKVVLIQHMHKRCGVVNRRCLRFREAQLEIKCLGIAGIDLSGSAVLHILPVAARGGEFFVGGISVPDLFEYFKRAARSVFLRLYACRRRSSAALLFRAGGKRESHGNGKYKCSNLFHNTVSFHFGFCFHNIIC